VAVHLIWKMKKMSKAAQAYIKDGNIIIQLPVRNLKMAVKGYVDADFGLDPFVVTDSKAFAKGVVRALNEEEEDGRSPIHRMFDAAFEQALADGSDGVEDAVRCDLCGEAFSKDKIIIDTENEMDCCEDCF
jgi:hypothetical protein